MNETQTILHIHENKESRPDSITIGTPGKGGEIKVYFNTCDSKEQIEKLINSAIDARAYMQKQLGME
jgi:hypothetical protein